MSIITVLMTVYNAEKYLKRSISSVLNQTLKDFEFLIVEDASTDGSLAILKTYKDWRIRIIQNPSNLGQTASLNVGLREARAEFIARMDADDMAFPDWLEKVHAFATKNPEYSVVSCQAVIIDENDDVKAVTAAPLSYEEAFLKNITESSINHVGSLMVRDHVLKIGGYDSNYKIVADYDLWVRFLIGKYKIINIKNCLTVVRNHSASATSAGENKRDLETIEIMQRNIISFTNSSLTIDELSLLWRILHNIKNCKDESCDADKLINRIYDSLKQNLGLPYRLTQKVKERKKRAIFKKRVFVLLNNGKAVSARDALKEEIRINGWFSFFGLVFFLSFFGVFNNNIEFLYSKITTIGVRLKFSRAVKRVAG